MLLSKKENYGDLLVWHFSVMLIVQRNFLFFLPHLFAFIFRSNDRFNERYKASQCEYA